MHRGSPLGISQAFEQSLGPCAPGWSLRLGRRRIGGASVERHSGRERRERAHGRSAHSHSIVPGGLEVTSSATRLTPSTSLMMREEMRSTSS